MAALSEAASTALATRRFDWIRRNPTIVIGALILGLLATLAFAKEKKKGYQTFMEEIGRYLSSQGGDGRKLFSTATNTLDDFINMLTGGNSMVLQRASAESLAYLAYLKRFRAT